MHNENVIPVNFNFGLEDVRTLIIDDQPWFVANDIARILGYKKPADAIRKHCKGVSDSETPSNGGIQKVKIIPESDIYRLVFRSNLPSAEKFEDWVTGEVLPQLRKTGKYAVHNSHEQKKFMSSFLKVCEERDEAYKQIAIYETVNAQHQQMMLREGSITVTAAADHFPRFCNEYRNAVVLNCYLRDIGVQNLTDSRRYVMGENTDLDHFTEYNEGKKLSNGVRVTFEGLKFLINQEIAIKQFVKGSKLHDYVFDKQSNSLIERFKRNAREWIEKGLEEDDS